LVKVFTIRSNLRTDGGISTLYCFKKSLIVILLAFLTEAAKVDFFNKVDGCNSGCKVVGSYCCCYGAVVVGGCKDDMTSFSVTSNGRVKNFCFFCLFFLCSSRYYFKSILLNFIKSSHIRIFEQNIK
jgi:hypothetical protein